MTISAVSAGKRLGEQSGWRLSNLAIQKLLYISHMVFLGERNGTPLIAESFEAWDYGPVVPSLYHQLKIFGSSPVKDIFYSAQSIEGSEEAGFLDQAWTDLGTERASKLVAITHWERGAWARHYQSGRRGIRIPNEDILSEFKERMGA